MTRLRVSNGLVLAALAGVLLASSPLFAQFHSAIEGTVTDSSGAAVPAAQVVLTNQDTGVSQTTVSNDTGAYHFPSLGLGKYTLTATKQGFQT
ncbi:MAG TPA: carboxypeptidase-like regulatory domain-containing protein, partial [Candidatus Sulfotelmatobacter sp.]|nr:carboxypeptidase-like regulatory domain-containing protein [Candidatus Sulfotelmatobacter sp.]